MTSLRSLLLAAAALAASIAAPARATTVYCVDNAAEFQTVVDAIDNLTQLTDGVDIRLRPGTFSAATDTSGVNIYFQASLTGQFAATYTVRLSGGWNAGCTQQAAPGGPPSIIDGLGVRTVLAVQINTGANSANASVNTTVDQVELVNFGKGVYTVSTNGQLTVRYAQFRNGKGRALGIDLNDTLYLHNSLFEQNTVTAGNDALVYAASDLTVEIANNTFRNNTLQAFGGGIRTSVVELGPALATTSGVGTFENNIVYGTTLCASSCYLIQTDASASIRNNIIDPTKFNGTPLFASTNINVNPLFASGSGALLGTTSPARDIGRTAAMNGIAFDLAGAPRVRNGVVDLGAAELEPPDAMFADDFE